MIRTQVQLTEQQAHALKIAAARQGVSIAELVRRSVDDMFERESAQDDERRRRALAVVGLFKSGAPPDMAVEHDKYLDEAYLD